ncbi:MAG TPA: hypothetical protein VNO21_12915 [Polyangiaceae bacterium]|nr:hypothetical protein [Polyangiaceae bacterium]
MRRPQARCIVVEGPFIDAPLDVDLPPFVMEVRAALKERFVFSEEAKGLKLYRAP